MKKETLKKLGTPIALLATIGALMLVTGCAHHHHGPYRGGFKGPRIHLPSRHHQPTAGQMLGNTIRAYKIRHR